MAGTTWFTFTAGKKAKGSEVNSNFDWIEGSILPMNAGSSTTNVYDLGSATYKWRSLYLGTDAYITQDLDVTRYSILRDDVKITSGKKLFLDSGVNDFIAATGAGIGVFINSLATFHFADGNVVIPATNQLYLDGGIDTYIYEGAANDIAIYAGGSRGFRIKYDGATGTDVGINADRKLYLDGMVHTYITESTDNNVRFYLGGTYRYGFSATGTGLADAEWITFSPDIKKDPKYKDLISISADDFLNWAVDDAKKPTKPYEGVPQTKKKNETGDNIFDTEEEAEAEIRKYAKDPAKIAIGTALWAEKANEKLKELEQRLEALGG